MARFKRTKSSSARLPMRFPIFVRATVVILSTIRLLPSFSPLLWLGFNSSSRNRGADVGLVVNGQHVTDNRSSKRSSCRMATGRGFPV